MKNRMRTVVDSLGEHDRRVFLWGAAAVVLIMIYMGVFLPLVEDWSSVRNELKTYQSQLESVAGTTPGSKARIVGLYQTVPFVEMPQEEDVQRKLFWNKTYDQLKTAGINANSGLSYVSSAKKKTGLRPETLRLKFTGSCKYEQLVKFLTPLNENPYLVSIEELSVKTNEKQPEQVDVEVILATFVEQEIK